MAEPLSFHTTYNAIEQLKPSGLRGRLRSIALDGLSLMDQLKGIRSDLAKPRVQFIYIHHIFKDEEAGLHALLRTLGTGHAFISHSEGVNRILEGRVDKPYISISSDDGFKNNVRAAEILADHGAPSCFFINPSVIGEHRYAVVQAYCAQRLHFPPVEFMDWKDVERVLALGHEIGSHTMGHGNVALMSREEFEEDCATTHELLHRRCGTVLHFAFPYGRFHHFNEMAREVVFRSGFSSCATAERGCHIPHQAPTLREHLCLRRDHVILKWKMPHILYFLAKNARQASPASDLFPYSS